MVEDGILCEEDHVELVEGEILMVPPQGPEHRAIKADLHERLADAYRGKTVHVIDQDPLRAGSRGLPEADLAVIRGRPRDYLSSYPTGDASVLVIEIAKTSQARDRAKATDYAVGGVPVYWLLDLVARRLDVHVEPDRAAGRYRRVVSLGEDDLVELPELGERWSVRSLLP